MVVAVVVTLLVFWIGVGVVLALLIGRTARVADERQRDAMLRSARPLAAPSAPARVAERAPARV